MTLRFGRGGGRILASTAVACFVFKRPEHTEQLLHSLVANTESASVPIFIYCDGPSGGADAEGVSETIDVVRSFGSKLNLQLIASESNLGLATSITRGVSEVLGEFDRVVVLEDDLILSPHFLSFMLQGLETYRDDDDVISVHGYNVPHSRSLDETFFLRGADCWGWATWKRGWDLFEPDAGKLAENLRSEGLLREFNYGVGTSHSDLLLKAASGQIDSWAIRWHASAILNRKFTLYPSRSLVANAGMDGSGTHCSPTGLFDGAIASTEVSVARIPVVESLGGLKILQDHLRLVAHDSRKRKRNRSRPIQSLAGRLIRWARVVLSPDKNNSVG